MAKAKDIPEVYLCEIDADRESIVPYAGQKCIMQNGDIYMCVRDGVWGKIGVEPSTYTVTFKVSNDTYKTVVCVQGTSIDAPEAPEQIGATFSGWEDSNDNIINFPYTPSADTTLTAIFTPIVPPTPMYTIYSLDGTISGENVIGTLDYSFGLVVGDVWKVTITSPLISDPIIITLTVSTYTESGVEYKVLRSQGDVSFRVFDNATITSDNVAPKQNSVAYIIEDFLIGGQIGEATFVFEKI